LLFGLLVTVAAVFVIEDRSRELWPTVLMKTVFFLLGVGIMALAIQGLKP
jgi:hypothetical protein